MTSQPNILIDYIKTTERLKKNDFLDLFLYTFILFNFIIDFMLMFVSKRAYTLGKVGKLYKLCICVNLIGVFLYCVIIKTFLNRERYIELRLDDNMNVLRRWHRKFCNIILKKTDEISLVYFFIYAFFKVCLSIYVDGWREGLAMRFYSRYYG